MAEKPGQSNQPSLTVDKSGNIYIDSFNYTHLESTSGTTIQQHQNLSNNLFLNSTVQNTQTNYIDKSKEPEVIKDLNFEVPSLPKYTIIGRVEDADKVEALMRRIDLKIQRRVAICGMGGLGKTTLAIYCVKVWNEKQDSGKSISIGSNVAFIDGDNRMIFEESVKRLARKLKIIEGQKVSELLKDIVNLYKNANLQLLIIVDNINNLDDIADLLELYQDNLYILATSQNIEIDLHFNIYKLKLLSEQEGLRLTLSILDHNLENDDVPTRDGFVNTFRELYTYTEGLPITLSHAGAWLSQSMLKKQRIKRMKRSTEFYLKLLQQYLATFKDELQKDFPEQFKTRISKSAFLSLKLNIDKLSCVESKKFILMLGYLNPNAIRVELFHSLFADDTLETVLDETSKYFLVDLKVSVLLVRTFDHAVIRIHRLVQEVAKIHLSALETSLGSLVLRISCRFHFFLTQLKFLIENSSRFLNLCSKDDLVSTINKIFENNDLLCYKVGYLERSGCNIANYTNWYLPHKLILLLVFRYEEIYIPILSRILQFFKDEFCSPVGDGITLQHLVVVNSSVGPGIISFIHRYVDVNRCTSTGVSPLHVAAVVTADNALQQIVSLGVDVNVRDFNGNTPLHFASRWNVQSSSVDVLLSMENVDVNSVNKDGHCPLYLALLETRKLFGEEIPLSLLKAGANYDFTYDNGDTVLHRLAKWNYSEAVKFLLLQPDVKLDVQNKNGETPLYLAVTREGIDWDNTALSLLKAGARYDFQLKNGENILHLASRLCFDQVVDFICKNLQTNDFFGVNDVTHDGNSPAHLAVVGYHFCDYWGKWKSTSDEDIMKTINHLVNAGANLELKNNAGETPLDIVTRKNEFKKVIDLLKNLNV